MMRFCLLLILNILLCVSFGNTNDNCDNIICPDDESECEPNGISMTIQCDYIECCCDELIDAGLINYLTFQYCTLNKSQPFGGIILAVLLVYSFVILGNIAGVYQTIYLCLCIIFILYCLDVI